MYRLSRASVAPIDDGNAATDTQRVMRRQRHAGRPSDTMSDSRAT